jgi:hypothetical protein
MIFPFLIAAFGSLFSAAVTIFSIVSTIASAIYQRKRQKKLESELDKQKGFNLVTERDPIHLPLVYGTQMVGGVRSFHKTMNVLTQAPALTSQGWKSFRYGLIDPNIAYTGTEIDRLRNEFLNGLRGTSRRNRDGDVEIGNPVFVPPTAPSNVSSVSKNQWYITQQALCFAGIDDIIDIEVNSQSWNRGKFQHILECHRNGGIANPTATASGVPATNLFTNIAWINAVYFLNRDEPNYQGTPSLNAFIKGQRLWNITNNNSVFALGTKSYSNNNSLVLLDYLLRPSELGGLGLGNLSASVWLAGIVKPNTDKVWLKFFWEAAQLCDTVVETLPKVRGRVNGVPDIDNRVIALSDREDGKEIGETVYVEATDQVFDWVPVSGTNQWVLKTASRVVKLYECNITLDTQRTFRDNIELILETMSDAELVYSEGKYKLILNYPENNAAQELLLVDSYTDANIVNGEVSISYPGASDRLNRVVVKFNNEQLDFGTDSVSWPQWGDANHTKLLAEDNGKHSKQEIFLPGCSISTLALAKAETMVRQSRLYVGDELITPNSGFSLNQKLITLKLDRRALILETGDLFKLTSLDAEITNEVFKVETIKYTKKMEVEVTASQFNHTNLKYSSKVTTIPRPVFVFNDVKPPITAFGYVPNRRFGQGEESNGYLTWAPPINQAVKNYYLYYSDSLGNIFPLGVTTEEYFDLPATFLAAQSYFFIIKYEISSGAMFPGSTVIVNNLISLLPAANLTALSGINSVLLRWTNEKPQLVLRYEIFRGLTSNRSLATRLALTTDLNFTVSPLSTSNHYFWVDAISKDGSVAVMSVPLLVQASELGIKSIDIAEIVNLTSFAAGIRPVEVLGALPGIPHVAGRQVFLTTDNKLYRNTGTGWTRAVDGGDLVANSIVTGSIAAGAVNTSQLAANAVIASKIAVTSIENLWPDGSFGNQDTELFTVTGTGATSAFPYNLSRTGGNSLGLVRPAGQHNVTTLKTEYYAPVRGGHTYWAETEVVANASGGISAGFYFRVNWWDVNKVFISQVDIANDVAVPNDWVSFSRQLVAPSTANFASWQLFNWDTNTTAVSLFVDRVVLRKANAAELTVDGTITGNLVAAATLTGNNIVAGSINTRTLNIDEKLTINETDAGFVMGKASSADFAADGMFMGRTLAAAGGPGFGFLMGRTTAAGKKEYIQHTTDTGLVIVNAQYALALDVSPATQTLTTSQTFVLAAGVKTISFTALGGGASPINAGGLTRVRLFSGATDTGVSWSSAGGLAGGSPNGRNGQSSLLGTGGAGGSIYWVGGSNNGYQVIEPPTPGTGFGAGGGSDRDSPVSGGRAATATTVNLYDVSAVVNPRLVITIGAAGTGVAAGSPGVVQVQQSLATLVPAGVIPLYPTAVGSFTKAANATGTTVFPDLGVGMWVLTETGGNELRIGRVVIDEFTNWIDVIQARSVTFIANRRPEITVGDGNARTIRYFFYRMKV